MSKATSGSQSVQVSRQSRSGQLALIILVLIVGQTALTIVETLSIRSQQQKILYHDLDLIRSVSRIRAEYALQLTALKKITALAQAEGEIDPKNWEHATSQFRSQGRMISQSASEAGEQIERSEKAWPEYAPFAGHLASIGRDINQLDAGVLTIARLAEEGRQKEIQEMTSATSANAAKTRKRIELLWQDAQDSVTTTTQATEQHARLLLLGWLALICLLGLAVAGLHHADRVEYVPQSAPAANPKVPQVATS